MFNQTIISKGIKKDLFKGIKFLDKAERKETMHLQDV